MGKADWREDKEVTTLVRSAQSELRDCPAFDCLGWSGVSGRFCDAVDSLIFNWRESPESTLTPAAVVGLLDPRGDGETQFVARLPSLGVEHVLLQQGEK